jgi:HK97 family phage major capsid protein
MASNIIRKAIANAIYKVAPEASSLENEYVTAYTAKRWGSSGTVTKAVVNPSTIGTLTNGSGTLVSEHLDRDEFVLAVLSGSILGKLVGVIEVPALTRVNVETTPTIAPFVGENMPAPAYQGAFGFVAADVRKVSIVGVFTEELLRMTGNAAEGVVSGQLQRALSRGIDAAFIGTQTRTDVVPNGLGAVSIQAASFNAGVLAFEGDLTKANVLVNPLTAATLRSAIETEISATGGKYAGLNAITSYAVPVGKIFIVDASRVLAYIGAAVVEMSSQAMITMDDGSGVAIRSWRVCGSDT